MPWSMPDLAVVRDSLRSLIRPDVDLEGLEATYLQGGRDGLSRVLYQAPRPRGDLLRVTARRVDPAKGRKVEAAINASFSCAHTGASRVAFFAPALGLLFQVFPADRRLPALPVAVDPSAMLPILAKALADRVPGRCLRAVAVQVTRYKPERKCMLRYALTWSGRRGPEVPSVVWARIARAAKFERTHNVLPTIHAASAGLGFRLPEPLGVLPELGMELFGAVPGEVLFALVGSREFPSLCRRLGETLCRFHALPVKLEETMGLQGQLVRLAENAAEFACMLPAEQARIEILERELAARLRPLPPAPLRLIHRDFHGDNVLVADDGHLTLLDFEDCAMGEPADDVASNWAQLTWHVHRTGVHGALPEAGRREFLEGYRSHADNHTAACLATYAAMHCFLYAQQCLRHPQDPSRYENARAMLAVCGQVLQHGLD